MKALKMSIIHVVVFVLSWTPYTVMATWDTVDKEGAERVPGAIQASCHILYFAQLLLHDQSIFFIKVVEIHQTKSLPKGHINGSPIATEVISQYTTFLLH